MRTALLFLLVPFALWADEPSALGAGNLDSPNPYGLTSAEKTILKNKKVLKELKDKSYANQTQVDALLERIDGLQTIIEGLNQKTQSIHLDVKRLQSDKDNDTTPMELQKIQAAVKANEENILKLKSVLDEFSKLIDDINSNYVSRSEYNTLVNEVNAFKKLVSSELSNVAKAPVKPAKKVSNATLAKEAAENYQKKYYTKAIEQYEELINRHYKPAYAHYMIGEMWYYRKDYGKAIAYFKESAKRYDKASYMPTLLLHTAISMKNTGDAENANSFFNAVVLKYPDSKAAEIARTELGSVN